MPGCLSGLHAPPNHPPERVAVLEHEVSGLRKANRFAVLEAAKLKGEVRAKDEQIAKLERKGTWHPQAGLAQLAKETPGAGGDFGFKVLKAVATQISRTTRF